ncbi:DNA excision repair protein ERCC-1 [Drosophila guanche]|uniref:DNA excision repair protein ERCC-1 n=1 Tax=Drosophila guanche TaxID=7266 RepID=A0A3B0JTI0_DROGU|nr:DNA excision repair protein ERCC-1 [Drosophila guanche]SPP74378.1 blast:DNA excision repair protein ERCC-1 [Drosophila guanche]
MDDFDDDSFDDVLGSMEMPTSPKKPKVQPSNNQAPAATTSTANSSTTASITVVKPASNPHSVLVHSKQRGNPILKSIQSVPLEYRDDIVPDYVVGRTTCILFLSLKYHNLNPDYICQRLKALGKMYELRVLLVQVDTPEPHNALKSLTRISLLADLTMMLAWNAEEAGKMIETYKQFEKRSPDLIMERVDSNPHQKLVAALTNIKPVNKTDAVTLLQTFGNLGNVITASEERLSQVMGLGPRKAKKLYKTLQEPFLSK